MDERVYRHILDNIDNALRESVRFPVVHAQQVSLTACFYGHDVDAYVPLLLDGFRQWRDRSGGPTTGLRGHPIDEVHGGTRSCYLVVYRP